MIAYPHLKYVCPYTEHNACSSNCDLYFGTAQIQVDRFYGS